MSAKKIVEQRLNELAHDNPSSIFDVGFNSVLGEASKNFLSEGWDATVRKVALLEKTASHHDDEFVAGQQAAIELLTNLSEEEFLGILEGETPMSFELGKEAAYSDFVELAEKGHGFSDVMSLVSQTLSAELEKTASEEEVDYRMGVDAACHQFMKIANELYGEYDLDGRSDEEILDFALLKIAEEEEKKKEGMSTKKKLAIGGAGLATGLALAPGVIGAAKGVRNAPSGAKNKALGAVMGAQGGYQAVGGAIKGGASKLKNKAGSAYNSMKERMGKKASDERVQEALEVLAEAGLLDD